MHTTVVIVGAGHAGLAMSSRLTERSIDHVVLERGEVANSWRTERWDSLRLLTPNWLTQLPGARPPTGDPHGYAAAADVATSIDHYATTIAAPIHTNTTVTSVTSAGSGYAVDTTLGRWRSDAVVIASGANNLAAVPAIARHVPADIAVHTPMTYRRPDQLEPGGVLVVGASATGVQLADEIHRSGRPVTLSVGEHVRMPRTYRGHDIFWWIDRAGILDQRHDDVDDLVRARHLPSPQLIGTPERRTVDLNTLVDTGVQIVGRLGRLADGLAHFSGSLAMTCKVADLKANRLLATLDEWANTSGLDQNLDPPSRLEPTAIPEHPTLEVNLARAGIRTILLATGYRPDNSWVHIPVLDRNGRIQHNGGVADIPGLYLIGHPMLRRRRSSYISGAGPDSAELSQHLHRYLDKHVRSATEA